MSVKGLAAAKLSKKVPPNHTMIAQIEREKRSKPMNKNELK